MKQKVVSQHILHLKLLNCTILYSIDYPLPFLSVFKFKSKLGDSQ